MAAGEIGIFAGDAQVAGAGNLLALFDRFGDRQATMPDIEIDRRVEVGISELLDHVGADDADLRRAVGIHQHLDGLADAAAEGRDLLETAGHEHHFAGGRGRQRDGSSTDQG